MRHGGACAGTGRTGVEERAAGCVPAEPQKCCDAEVQELMIRAERAEALLEEYRELYKNVIEKI